MNKLKILWRNRKTWNNCFGWWHNLMFPHLHNPKYWRAEFEEMNTKDNAYWFWKCLNNWGSVFDEVE